MQFRPYNQATGPNIVVDGSPNDSTLRTLSHWPKSGTPVELKADTSAEITFNYLDSPQFHVDAECVTNNHFDQDGLMSVFALTNPPAASRSRHLIIDTAAAGDFGIYQSRTAARINFAISSWANQTSSPLPGNIFELPYPAMAAQLYTRILEMVPALLTAPESFKSLWEEEDSRLRESEERLRQGKIAIEENRGMDFAVVRLPESLDAKTAHRFTSAHQSACHPMAIYNVTPCTRILVIQGESLEFQYRYEGWVQLVSRRPAGRVDLSGLAAELNDLEKSGGKWVFEGVDAITPRLRLEEARETTINVDIIQRRIQEHLIADPVAWHPYDP